MPKGYSVSIQDENKMVARLYDTDIVIVQGKTVTLDSGGWKTMHTKKCINLTLEKGFLRDKVYLFQKKGQWYVEFLNQFNTVETVMFKDGLKLEL